MLGVESQKRSLLIAGALAICSHLLLISVDIATNRNIKKTTETLRVTLIREVDEPPNPEATDPETTTADKQTVDEVLATNSPSSDPTPTSNSALQTSVTSLEFKGFIQRETESYRSANPQTVATFSESFKDAAKEENVVPFNTQQARAQARRVGVFMSEDKDGNRRCGAYVAQLLSGGGSAEGMPATFVGKDCTPKKKFELKLNNPNNGWMNR